MADATPAPNNQSPDLLVTRQAELLSSSQKSKPYWGGRTPRWVCQIFYSKACLPVKGGIFRVNQTEEDFLRAPLSASDSPTELPGKDVNIMNSHAEGVQLNTSFARYRENPKEIRLQIIQTVLKIHNRIVDLHSDNFNQLEQQLDLTAEYLYETKENLIFNHPDYGLLNQVSPWLKAEYDSPPTPDVLDDMLSAIWKRPDFYVMHPEALQSFHKECNRLGLTLESCEMLGSSFSTWRGLPLLPSNKLHLTRLDSGAEVGVNWVMLNRSSDIKCSTHVALMRVGEGKQGVVSLYAEGSEGTKRFPFVDIKFMGISDHAVSSYLMTMYAGMAVLTPGALCVAKVTI